MRKFILGVVAIILVGIVVMSLPKQGKEEDKQVADGGVENHRDRNFDTI